MINYFSISVAPNYHHHYYCHYPYDTLTVHFSSVGASVIISYRTTSLILPTFICVEVDLATSMAEMFNLGDSDQNEKLEKTEFIRVGEKKHSKAVP